MKSIILKNCQKNVNMERGKIKTKNYINEKLKSQSDTNTDTENEELIQKNVNQIVIMMNKF